MLIIGLLFWVIPGLVTGLVASQIRSGSRYGTAGDLVMGIVGALIGGFLVSLFVSLDHGITIYPFIGAFIGACTLIVLLRTTSSTRPIGYVDDKRKAIPPVRKTSLPPRTDILESSYTQTQLSEQPVRQSYVPTPIIQFTPHYTPPTLSLFISHSSRDDEFGLKLVEDLRRELGSDEAVWYDSEGGLYGGESWWRKIVSVLEKCDVFVIIVSPNSMNSKWVMKELDIATSERKRIVPVLYRQCDVPADLRAIQQISFLDSVSYNLAFNKLIQALKY